MTAIVNPHIKRAGKIYQMCAIVRGRDNFGAFQFWLGGARWAYRYLAEEELASFLLDCVNKNDDIYW
jgi:hypothetical protein